MDIRNIKKESISDQVFAQLLEMISSGQWRSGDKILSENELMMQFAVSRSSVRTAVQKLIALGILDSRQGEGTFVCEQSATSIYFNAIVSTLVFNSADTREILEFRSIIEVETARLAAQRATDAEIAALTALHERLMLLPLGNSQTFAALDMEFHVCIANMARNNILIRVFGMIRNLIVSNLIILHDTIGPRVAYNYHPMILQAIRNHDSEAAAAAMKGHINALISGALHQE